MPDPARTVALHLLEAVETQPDSFDSLLESRPVRDLDERDRRFVRQLVLGTLRWQGRLDWILDQFTRRPLAQTPPRLRQILRLGAYQLLWLDRVPERAAVHSSVELAKRFAPGGKALINAVLRQVVRRSADISYPPRQSDLTGHLAAFQSHPRWLIERWLKNWGESATEALLQAANEPSTTFLRLNPLRTDSQRLAQQLATAGVQVEAAGPLSGFFAAQSGGNLFSSPAYRQGLFQIQDINAGLPVALLDPQPGERILDMCSAPGGKATQIAERMGDSGLVLAADRSPQRLRRVGDNARRLGLNCVHPLAWDARREGLGGFHRVLADVPCTGTGTLGRRPDARWRKRPEQLAQLTGLQDQLLHRAFACLRPGGVLVYSTCSLECEENAERVERFLAAEPRARLETAEPFFPGHLWAQRFVETRPGREPGDGCFAARIIHRGNA
ncbi:MAG: 16S rRNA (cytosine(967)-C(5))-methyltransferase RsmB [Candidatus Latescibacteria bacterium]|nr:16S rRNA (cytosine(967)-C(5))-methyltransferase RsmB [Candidatus Latescibacterota bacterium]